MNSPWTSLLPTSPSPSQPAPGSTALIPLPVLGLITLAGPESMKFLQGQTTTDFRAVEAGRVLPGAICSLKGRVLFSFIAVPQGNDVALALPTDQLEAALAHLKKYAVFSRTQLKDASAEMALLGIVGPAGGQVIEELGLVPPEPGRTTAGETGAWAVRLFAEERYLLALPAEQLREQWAGLRQRWPLAPESAWWAADIQAGFATVFAAARDRFQPQELNYHALDAVSYNKGCYTGQEVVARLYFRGKLKQRLYRLRADGVSSAGAVFAAGGSLAGEVVMAAVDGDNTTALLAVVRNSAARDGGLTLGEDGPALRIEALPYPLPADKEE